MRKWGVAQEVRNSSKTPMYSRRGFCAITTINGKDLNHWNECHGLSIEETGEWFCETGQMGKFIKRF